MRRLSTLIFGFLVLFLAGTGGTIYYRMKAVAPANEAPPQPQGADYRIKDVHINETLKGDLRWQLDAEEAEIFDDQKKTQMRRVKVTVFQKSRVWVVTGDEGEMQNETRDVTVRGNVVVTSDDGLRFTSEDLHWKTDAKRLWTDGPVTVVKGQTTITGRGFSSEIEAERALIRARVRVLIKDPRNANLAVFGGGSL